jgi:predicted metalloenzyme YecM
MRDILGDYTAFIQNISAGLERLGIAREELTQMDHICYRVETAERYQELKQKVQEEAELVAENQVNGREIATFEFAEPLEAAGWTVPYLELPAPKAGSPYKDGWEHVELVTVGGLDKFLERHSDLPFSLGSMGKLINPEAELKTDTISVKFHEQPLGAVARIEKRLSAKGIDYDI